MDYAPRACITPNLAPAMTDKKEQLSTRIPGEPGGGSNGPTRNSKLRKAIDLRTGIYSEGRNSHRCLARHYVPSKYDPEKGVIVSTILKENDRDWETMVFRAWKRSDGQYDFDPDGRGVQYRSREAAKLGHSHEVAAEDGGWVDLDREEAKAVRKTADEKAAAKKAAAKKAAADWAAALEAQRIVAQSTPRLHLTKKQKNQLKKKQGEERKRRQKARKRQKARDLIVDSKCAAAEKESKEKRNRKPCGHSIFDLRAMSDQLTVVYEHQKAAAEKAAAEKAAAEKAAAEKAAAEKAAAERIAASKAETERIAALWRPWRLAIAAIQAEKATARARLKEFRDSKYTNLHMEGTLAGGRGPDDGYEISLTRLKQIIDEEDLSPHAEDVGDRLSTCCGRQAGVCECSPRDHRLATSAMEVPIECSFTGDWTFVTADLCIGCIDLLRDLWEKRSTIEVDFSVHREAFIREDTPKFMEAVAAAVRSAKRLR